MKINFWSSQSRKHSREEIESLKDRIAGEKDPIIREVYIRELEDSLTLGKNQKNEDPVKETSRKSDGLSRIGPKVGTAASLAISLGGATLGAALFSVSPLVGIAVMIGSAICGSYVYVNTNPRLSAMIDLK